MQKVQCSIAISAPRELVWRILWDDATYRQWTSVFTEGSHAVTDWKEGSKVLFLGPNGDGMYSIIAKNTPLQFMSFQHLGEIKNNVEVAKEWAGATENYTLSDQVGGTLLLVEMDTLPEFEAYFSGTFPKALAKIKEICER